MRERRDHRRPPVSPWQLTEAAHELRMWIQNVIIPGAMIVLTYFATKKSQKETENED